MRTTNYVQVAGTEFWVKVSREELRRLEAYLGDDKQLVSETTEKYWVYWTVEEVKLCDECDKPNNKHEISCSKRGPYAKYWKGM